MFDNYDENIKNYPNKDIPIKFRQQKLFGLLLRSIPPKTRQSRF